jgi:hypothetical protein
MSEHVVTVAAAQTGERGRYLDAVAAEAARFEAMLADLQALVGAESALAVEVRIRSLATTIASLEARYPAALTRWARAQRLELRRQAERLLGPSQQIVTAPQWASL